MIFRRILLSLIGILIVAFATYGYFHQGKIHRLFATYIGSSEPVDYAEGERLTNIPVFAPHGDIRGIVILISDSGGAKTREQDMKSELLARHLIVASVDFDTWRKTLNKEDGECIYLVSDLEALSKDISRRLDLDVYYRPVVVGIGEGGTIAYAAAADAPQNTLAGTVALDPSLSSHTKLPSCVEDVQAIKASDGGYAYEINATLPSPATLIRSSGPFNKSKDAARQHIAALINEPSFEARMKMTSDTALNYAISDAASAQLPIVDMPAKHDAKAIVIFFSGDGGWRDIDMEIGQWLQNKDVHVIGIDALRYFWTKRTPEEMATDIEQMIKQSDPDNKLPIALFGYSFGADAIPFAWPKIDESVQQQIIMIALMGVSQTADLQVSIDGWLGGSGDMPVLPALQKMPKDKTICIYGDEEDDTSCTEPSLAPMQIIKFPGDHHFDEAYEEMAKTLHDILIDKANFKTK